MFFLSHHNSKKELGENVVNELKNSLQLRTIIHRIQRNPIDCKHVSLICCNEWKTAIFLNQNVKLVLQLVTIACKGTSSTPGATKNTLLDELLLHHYSQNTFICCSNLPCLKKKKELLQPIERKSNWRKKFGGVLKERTGWGAGGCVFFLSRQSQNYDFKKYF